MTTEGKPNHISVTDADGRSAVYTFSMAEASRGLTLGCDPGCDIRLTGPRIRAVHARMQAMSNHWVVQYQQDGQRLPLPERFIGNYDMRVDRTRFEIEGNFIQAAWVD